MNDLLAGLAIALVLEGLLWALAPGFGRHMLREFEKMAPQQLVPIAWLMVAMGVGLFWLVRG